MKDAWAVVALLAIVAFGAALRVVGLHTIPPGLFFDEAANLFDIRSILEGARPIYFPANNGREPFFFYWASLFASRFGVGPYAIRLASAVIGTLTLPATFFCSREALLTWDADRRWSTWTALASTFVLSILYLHVHYSRIGLRTITLPLFLALSLGFLFRGIRTNSWWALLGAGLIGGLSIYTYISSRLAPALLLVPPMILATQRRFWWGARRMTFVGLVWIIVALPLGVYTIRHAADVQGHTDDVSIFNPANNHGDPTAALMRGISSTILSLDVVGTAAAEQNLPFRPLLDPLESVFFIVGLGALLAGTVSTLSRPRPTCPESTSTRATLVIDRPLVAATIVGWIVDQALPSALAVNPPGFIRMTGLLPALAIVVGLGIGTTYRWCRRRPVAAGYAPLLIAICLIASAGLTVRDYFFTWGPSPEAYHLMMADKVDSATYLDRLAVQDRVFLAPLWANDNTVKFYTQGSSIQTFDLGQGLVIPTDRSHDVHYVFPIGDDQAAPELIRALNLPVQVVTVRDDSGRYPLLTRLDVRGSVLPLQPESLAIFEEKIGLAQPKLDSPVVSPGGRLEFQLVWISQQPAAEDFTVFIHLRDSSNQTLAQADGQPVGGSYPTSVWRRGDIVWDHRQLEVPARARVGTYRLVAGMYRRETLTRLDAETPAGRAESDEVALGNIEVRPR